MIDERSHLHFPERTNSSCVVANKGENPARRKRRDGDYFDYRKQLAYVLYESPVSACWLVAGSRCIFMLTMPLANLWLPR